MSAADRYLEIMEILEPDELQCCEFDTHKLIHPVPAEKYRNHQKAFL